MTRYFVDVNDTEYDLDYNEINQKIIINNANAESKISIRNPNHFTLFKGTKSIDVILVSKNSENYTLLIEGKYYLVNVKNDLEKLTEEILSHSPNKLTTFAIKSPMPGLIHDILVEVGDNVDEDEPILILEAMKMENVIKSPVAGKISEILKNKGTTTEKGEILIIIEE